MAIRHLHHFALGVPDVGVQKTFSADDDTKRPARNQPLDVSFCVWGPTPAPDFVQNFEGCKAATKPMPL